MLTRAAPECETLVQALERSAASGRGSAGAIFLEDGRAAAVPYGLLLARARAWAGAFQRLGAEAGERCLVLVPTSPDFLFAFWGLVLVGAIPCPLPLPSAYGAAGDFEDRTGRIARYLGVRRAITTLGYADRVASALPEQQVQAVEALRDAPPVGSRALGGAPIRPDDLALIQCTSGSTGLPKGVMVTHANLVANLHQIGRALHVGRRDVVVSWLPLHHDMGLIGCVLLSIYCDMRGVFLSPSGFLRRPADWPRAISRYRGTISPAPNFAYRYLTARAREADMDGLDLSCWRAALCGSEPIDALTLAEFAARFADYGLPANAPSPCYGLAEATLAVSFHPLGTGLQVDRLARQPLAERGEVRLAGASDRSPIDVVSCGEVVAGTRIRIVDDAGADLSEGQAGHVQVRGPGVMKGYFALPDETAAVLRDGWLDTGDLGYLRGGGLRITGRHKELVVIRGRKYLPGDFERAAAGAPAVRRGTAVAFGVFDPVQGTEVLHLVCETDLVDPREREAASADIRMRVAEQTGILPGPVHLVPRNTVRKTSSGKLQRGRVKATYMASQAPVR
jgi:fatty-acyl-CoA synthase